MKRDIHITLTTDDSYTQHTGITLLSIIQNLSEDCEVTFWIISRSHEHDDFSILEKITSESGHQIKFITANSERLENLVPQGHFELENYFRLLLPELIDHAVTKVLHLDSDTIVLKDVSELYSTDLGDFLAAAVEDQKPPYAKKLGLKEATPYFNTGVILLNLDLMRKERIGEQAIEFAKENPNLVKWVDQDALNAVAKQRIKRLHPAWNALPHLFKKELQPLIATNVAEFTTAKEAPRILHFAGAGKPWIYLTNHPYKKKYWDILRTSPWKKAKPDGYTLSNRLKKVEQFFRRKKSRTSP